MHELFDRLRALELPPNDYAVFGSGPLLIRKMIPASNDLDVLCRGRAWRQVQSIGEKTYLEEHDVTIVSIDDGRITFGTEWAIGAFNIDELIDTAELVNGLPFVRLEHVVAYKQIADRPKDRQHLAAIRAYESSLPE